jgi:cell division protein FtsB
MKILNEGVGYELYSKGADRVVAQSKQLAFFAEKLAKLTRENKPLKERVKALKELKKWQDSIRREIILLEDDIDNLEGYKK